MGDPAVFLVVYGLLVAPLGMAALSLPVRRWADRVPWRRAQHHLIRWAEARTFKWSHPTREAVRIELDGGGRGMSVTCSPGVDGTVRTVGYRVEIDVDLPGADGVIFDGRSQAVVAGDPAWGWAIAGTGLTSEFEDRVQHVQVSDRRLVWSSYGSDLEEAQITRLVDRVQQAASLLAGRTLAEVLRHHALHAADPLHRRRCLAACFQLGGADLQVARTALEDGHPDVRMVAAARLCPDSKARAEIRRQLGPEFDEDVRLRALETARQVAPSELDPAWESLFGAASARLAHRAVEVARQLEKQERLHALVRDPNAAEAARIAAIEALERPDDPDFEALCADLVRSTRGLVRICAVDALGRIGDTDRIGMLRRIGSEAPLNSELFIASRAAVDLIQARCVAEAGSLSLFDPSGGIRGRLSLPAEDRRFAAGSPKAAPKR